MFKLYLFYRFSKENLRKVTHMVEDSLKFKDKRGSPLSPMQQVCLTLSYLASGSLQSAAGPLIGSTYQALISTVDDRYNGH